MVFSFNSLSLSYLCVERESLNMNNTSLQFFDFKEYSQKEAIIYKRICINPINNTDCKKEIIYSSKKSFNQANKYNRVCNSCKTLGKYHTKESKLKMSQSSKNRPPVSEETKRKMSESHKGISVGVKNPMFGKHPKSSYGMLGKKQSEKTRERMRIARMVQIEKLGGGPTYNPKACEFIDKLNKENGYNFQHALNGGEHSITGYYVDGYDKEKNVIFEYDEKHHYYVGDGKLKSKDTIRQQRIIDKINPVMFLRYDEKNNHLYDVIKEKI